MSVRPPRKASLPQRWRFHFEHAGWATPPGRLACAWQAAKAERAGVDQGWWMDVIPDWERDDGPRWEAVLYDWDGNVLSALGGIDTDPDDDEHNYYRVIYAELAMEVIPDVRA